MKKTLIIFVLVVFIFTFCFSKAIFSYDDYSSNTTDYTPYYVGLLVGTVLVFLIAVGVASANNNQFAYTESNYRLYKVNINAISSNEPIDIKRCILIPANSDTTFEDLQYKEYAKYVKNALELRGYSFTNDIKLATTAIAIGYGIGPPEKHIYSYNIPIWGETGVSSTQTTGNIHIYGNYATYSETSYNTPSYGIIGYKTNIGSYTTYTRYITIGAINLKKFKKTKKISEYWHIDIFDQDKSGDLRLVFPYLIAASWVYFGEDTGKIIQTQIYENDPIIDLIRNNKTEDIEYNLEIPSIKD